MDSLELEAAVKPIHPRWTVDIHCCAELLSWPTLVLLVLRVGRHGEVGECELDMERHCDSMTYQHIYHSDFPVWKREVDDAVAKPIPEYQLSEDLDRSMPGHRSVLRPFIFP